MLNPAFFDMNKNQKFFFPHTNCDQLTNTEVINILWPDENDTFLAFLTKSAMLRVGGGGISVDHCLDKLRNNAGFVLTATSYMRLKFVLETLNIHLAEKLERMPKRLSCGEWLDKGVLEERVWKLDCLTTYLFNSMLSAINVVVGDGGVRTLAKAAGPFRYDWDAAFLDKLAAMNSNIQMIRMEPCKDPIHFTGPYNWADAPPSTLAPFPFIQFVNSLWNVVEPLTIFICDS